MTTPGTDRFGELLRRYRMAAALSQEALAARAGLSRDAIRALELGRRQAPRRATVALLAEALGLSSAERDVLDAVARGAALPAQAHAAPETAVAPVMSPLPVAPTPLIGREHEVEEAAYLLRYAGARLLTLTGPGGIGKTRLALALAAALQDAYADGVAFIDLSALRDTELVLPTVAQALGLHDAGGQDVQESVRAHLEARQMLLVLDNFEQVVAAAPRLAALVTACPRLALLVTSRTALRVREEQQYQVPPLAAPLHKHGDGQGSVGSGEDAASYPAVQLFVARARAVRPDFVLDAPTLAAVTEICARLDGLPLAIELAAARVALLPPAVLLPRLQRRLAILTGGARDTPDRQRTLRATIDWSYGLLTDEEQRLFRRLAVFVGGCTSEAAEAICALTPGAVGEGDTGGQARHELAADCADSVPLTILEGLASLLDKSLLRHSASGEEEPRVAPLETVREYALERLEASGEAEVMRRQHARFFLALAEQTQQNVEGPGQVAWLWRLEAEHDNLRAALDWTLQRGEAEMAVRLSGGLWDFWELRSHWSEGRRWLEAALAAGGTVSAASRVQALLAATDLARLQADYRQAQRLAAESLILAQQLHDKEAIADALVRLGHVARYHNDYTRALALFEESLALYRERDDKAGMRFALTMCGATAEGMGDVAAAHAYYQQSLAVAREMNGLHDIAASLTGLGRAALGQGDVERAQALLEEALRLQQQLEDKNCSAHSLRGLGEVALARDDPTAARGLLEQSLTQYREIDARGGAAAVEGLLGRVALAESDTEQAGRLYAASLRTRRELSDQRGIAACLEGWAEVALAQGQPRQAICACAAAAALRETLGAWLPPVEHARYEQTLSAAQAQLDEAAFALAWDEGRMLPWEQIVGAVLGERSLAAAT